jgi:probable HAF family extracellular repeat protein
MITLRSNTLKLPTRAPICLLLLVLFAAPVHIADAATKYAIAVARPGFLLRNARGQQVVRDQVINTGSGDIHSTHTVYDADGSVLARYESGALAIDDITAFSDTGILAGTRTTYTLVPGGYNTARRAFLYQDGTATDLTGALAAEFNRPNDTVLVSIGNDVNDAGVVVGRFAMSQFIKPPWRTFLYDHGAVTEATGVRSVSELEPLAINTAGVVVGSTSTTLPLIAAFSWLNGRTQGLVPFDAHHLRSRAFAVNAPGQIVGAYMDTSLTTPGTHAFFFDSGVFTDLGTHLWLADINSASVAVGAGSNAGAILFTNGTITDFNDLVNPTDTRAGITFGAAVAIANDGVIVVQSYGGTYFAVPLDDVGAAIDSSQYTFESDAQGWHSTGEPIVSVAASTAQHFSGAGSLAVQINSPGFASVALDAPPPHPGQLVTFHVYLPDDAHIDWIQPFALQGLEGGWEWSGNYQPASALQLGAWNTLTIQVPNDASALWQLGVEISSSVEHPGTVYIDSVDF